MSATSAAATKHKVLLTRLIPPKALKTLKESQEISLESWGHSNPIPRKEFLEKVRGVHGIYCSLTEKIDAELLDAAGPQLKVVSTVSVGFDHINVAECKKRGILIGNTPGVLTDATADLTVGLLIATARLFPKAMASVRNGEWGPWDPLWMCGAQVTNSTVGIVGLGRIGMAVAKRMRAFSIGRLLYSGRSPKPEAREVGGEHVPFDTLLTESDFVVVCCALNSETAGMFNKAAFSKMKKTAVFINTSRGGMVNQDDLYEALKNGTIRSAGLDVTTPEPLPTDSPLLTLDNCMILPHIGSATDETREAMAMIAVENLFAGLKGIPLPCPV